MPFDFPAAPLLDEVYTHAPSGLSYVWDGVMWKPGASTVTAPNPYVAKAGDTMLGPLALVDPDPIDPLHAAHRKYVDRVVAEQTLYQGTWQVAANWQDNESLLNGVGTAAIKGLAFGAGIGLSGVGYGSASLRRRGRFGSRRR